MKTVFITGGSKGIGRRLVEDFTRKGHKVIFTYHSSKIEAEQIIQGLREEGYREVFAFQCNMSNEKEVRSLFKRNKAIFKDIEILVNNAGIRDSKISGSPKPFLMTTSEEWWEVMYNNINGVINSSRAVLPLMIRNKSGRILNVTSLAGIKGNPGQSAYASSKAAITCFSKSLAKEVSSLGININCLAPGFIETEMTEKLSEEYIKNRVGNSLLGRMGTTREISKMVLYLTLEAPEFFINQELVIDGGMS